MVFGIMTTDIRAELIHAIKQKQLKSVSQLLNQIAEEYDGYSVLNTPDHNGQTVLDIALQTSFIEIITELLHHKADPFIIDKWKCSGLEKIFNKVPIQSKNSPLMYLAEHAAFLGRDVNALLIPQLINLAKLTPLILLDTSFNLVKYTNDNHLKQLATSAMMNLEDVSKHFHSFPELLKSKLINYLIFKSENENQENKKIFKFLALYCGLREALFFHTRFQKPAESRRLIMKYKPYSRPQYFYAQNLLPKIEKDFQFIKNLFSQLEELNTLLSSTNSQIDPCTLLIICINMLLIGFFITLLVVIESKKNNNLKRTNPHYEECNNDMQAYTVCKEIENFNTQVASIVGICGPMLIAYSIASNIYCLTTINRYINDRLSPLDEVELLKINHFITSCSTLSMEKTTFKTAASLFEFQINCRELQKIDLFSNQNKLRVNGLYRSKVIKDLQKSKSLLNNLQNSLNEFRMFPKQQQFTTSFFLKTAKKKNAQLVAESSDLRINVREENFSNENIYLLTQSKDRSLGA